MENLTYSSRGARGKQISGAGDDGDLDPQRPAGAQGPRAFPGGTAGRHDVIDKEDVARSGCLAKGKGAFQVAAAHNSRQPLLRWRRPGAPQQAGRHRQAELAAEAAGQKE